MNDRGALIRGLGIDLHGELIALRIETLVSPFTGEAGDARQPLCAAESLNIFVQNLIRRWRSRSRRCGNLHLIWIIGRRGAVLLCQTGCDLRPGVGGMAGEADIISL